MGSNYTPVVSLFFRGQRSGSFALGQVQGLSYKRVRVTQEFLCISSGVALDMTSNTSKKKFCIRSLTSIDFFKMVMARKNGKEGWRGRMTKKIDDFSSYALVSLCTPFPTHSTLHCLCSRKVFPAMRTICVSSTCRGMRLSFLERHWMAWSLSGRLDAIELAPPLCKRQPRHPYRHERITRDEEVPRASPKRLYLSRRCLCPQRCQHGSQEPESSHLFQLRPKGSLRDKMSRVKDSDAED